MTFPEVETTFPTPAMTEAASPLFRSDTCTWTFPNPVVSRAIRTHSETFGASSPVRGPSTKTYNSVAPAPSASHNDLVMSNLAMEWKSTDAYPDSVFLLTEKMGSIAGRAGPRFIQLMEIICELIVPESFTDPVPDKAVGNDYHDYLYLTGAME